MLISLDIENIAIIERASIEFETGLNVITGETGAGKTLIINSLNMVLGARTPHDLLREGSDYAKVSATFFSKEADKLLLSYDLNPDDGNIVITRKLYRDGRNICHINGSAVNVSTLKEIGEKLVVIHGQNDNLALSSSTTHLCFLDDFAKNDCLLSSYRTVYKELKEITAQIEEFENDKNSRLNELDYLTYQTEQIEKASLNPGEEEELLLRKKLLENSENMTEYSHKAYSLLSSDKSITDMQYEVKKALEKLAEIDPEAQLYSDKAAELYYELKELSRDISSYAVSIEYNSAELSEINDRLDTINSLKLKFNMDIPEILEFYEEASEKINYLQSIEDNKDSLVLKKQQLFKEATLLSEKLTEKRKESAKLLSLKISEELESLDMPKCVIDFLFKPSPLYESGAETVEFLISTNPKDVPKPLSKIASGGEISRIMLAIKSVFSDFDKIPTLLFDEIDTGVSGRAAEKIGKKMKRLSNSYQLILVTHLPIIAAFSKTHFLLQKVMCNDGFKTQIHTLSKAERIKEIARIISGDNISDISLQNARQMLEMAQEAE